MTEASNKHGPRLDDELAEESEDVIGAHGVPQTEGHRARWGSGVEPPPERVSRLEEQPAEGSLSHVEAADRSELAKYLQPSAFPADRSGLITSAHEMEAPEEIVASLKRLPDGTYETVAEVWEALGGTPERP